MPSIISNYFRILNSDTMEERINSQPTYMFIGKETAWSDEEIPDTPIESDFEKIQIYKDMLGVKRVPDGSVQSVVPRIDWVANAIYDQYDYRLNMIDGRKENGQKYNFYVLTDEFNVYKCLSNNNGAASTTKPTSQQITSFQTPDGYVWKYMYTLRSSDVFNYMTPEWIPIYTLDVNDGSSQWQVQQTAIDGAIHNIVVDSAGVGYNASDVPLVVITGDGTGAAAVCEVNSITGGIDRIVVTNPGEGYTQATITFTNTGVGVGAQATAILSPPGGHGKDARAELGGIHKMIKLTIAGTEGGSFPTTSFRQAGLLYLPLSTDLGTKITVTDASNFEVGDTVTGGTSGATGTIRVIEPNEQVIWIEDVTGDYIQTEVISNGTSSSSSSVVDNNVNIPLSAIVASASDVINNSGKIMYISNRVAINRSDSQTEEIRFVVSF